MDKRFPSWLVKKLSHSEDVHRVKALLRKKGLHTVCESARCPNIWECFSKPTATFMIMGNICTRACRFCGVQKGHPDPLDADEPKRVAEVVNTLKLRHTVITSVTRDDLEDGGAEHFAKTVECIREMNPQVSIEILTPDFQGSQDALRVAVSSRPDIFNHNLETVPRFYPAVRPGADYERSLRFLKKIKEEDRNILTKSGIMLGLGEIYGEVMDLMEDLNRADCDIVTVGQYLMPSKESIEVKEYIHPELFEKYKEDIENMGFLHVFSGPFVRSSYNAESVIEQNH
jgi:lipoic acid synthetase